MLSLTMMFSLMMLPAIAVVALSFVVSAFESNSSASVHAKSNRLDELMLF